MKSYLSGSLILIVWFGLLAMNSAGAPPPESSRLPDLDRRVGGAAGAAASERLAPTTELQAQVAGVRVDFDEVLGAPKWIRSSEGYLSGPGGVGKGISAGVAAGFAANDPYRTIKAFVQEHQALFGYGPDVLSTARVYREYVTPRSGMQTTWWQQELDGIEVFEGVFAAHMTKDGELIGISSQFMADPSAAANAGASTSATRSQPVITAPQAVVNAAGSLREQVRLADLERLGSVPASQDQVQQFTAGPFNQAIETRLVWLPMNPSLMRLCWEVTMTSRARGETFRLLVDARTGEVQVRRCLTVYLSEATYRVYTSDSPSPFSPGWSAPNSAQPTLTSRALVTWSALDTNASPNGWIDDGVNETRGNNVDAHTDINADNSPDLPRPQGAPFRVFDCPMDLTQSPGTYTNAAVVQLFYWCNYMHDRLYELGFTEAAGNFQNNNFGRGGLGNDAVQADAQDGSGFNNANFTPTSDGTAPRIQMYLFNGSTPYRDGDFDAEVVLHEYTHGLSERLVGGGVGISASQTGGMGEGWSDWYAMSTLSESGDDVNGCYATGGYVTYLLSGMTQNYYFGIRRYPYSTDLTKNPLTFKDIDPAQAGAHPGIPRSSIIGTTANEVHNMGEVWCVTLWEARANLIARYGWAVGNLKMMQLATDGMKLGPANPNFLQARDGILQADLVDNGGANRGELWAAFAKRGMGFSATSPASSTTTGLHESFDVPDDLQITPAVLSASGPVGGPFSPNPVSFVLTNTGSNTITWALNSTSSWVTVSPTSGTLAAGGPGMNIAVTVVPAATNFSLGAYTAAIQFTNRTSGQVQTRAFSLFVVGRSLFDDFDPGIDLSQWSGFGGTVGSTVIATNYGGYISSPNSLWFGDAGSRFATTLPINTSSGGAISFYICLANGSAWPWEQVDFLPDEGVVLEASTNSGSTWNLLGSYDTTAYYTWTAVTLAIPTAAQAPATQFRWRQKSHSGSSFDHWALDNVTIDAGPTPPTIQSQPQSQTLPVGNTATFNVGASGSSPLGYFWWRNGVPIPGANGSSYTTNNVQLSDSGSQFSCWVSNAFGVATSQVATLTVVVMPPSIVTQPVSQTVTVGNSAIFSVNAIGSTPLGYFWRRNGTPIAGANTSSYTTNNAQLADSGSQFSCLVSNAYGTILSSNATLFVTTVSTPVFLNGDFVYLPINTNGVFMAASTGGRFNSAGTGGSAGVDFWWPGSPVYNYVIGVGGVSYADGNLLSITVNDLSSGSLKRALIDATVVSGLHFTRDISFAANSKAIKIVDTLQNYGSSTLSSLATLDSTDPDQDSGTTYSTLNDVVSVNLLNDLVVATGPSTGLSLGFGADSGTQIPSAVGFDNRDAYAYLTVVDPDGASGDIAINLAQNYGSLSPGQSRSVTWYMVFDVSKTAVINAFASLGSTTNPPTITSQPVNQTVFTGGTATFGVAATGTLPLSYQWNFNGTNLSGATNALLVLTNVQFSQAGSYAVLVTNAFGSILSSNAILTVNPPPPCVTPPTGLISWWPGEGNANDIAGTNHGTLLNGAVCISGKVGQAFRFTGGAGGVANPAIQIPYSPSLTTSNFSFEAWINPLSQVTNAEAQSVIFGESYGFAQLLVRPGSIGVRVTIQIATSPSTFYGVLSTNEIPIGQFSHVVGTWDGTTLRLYLNGILNNQVTLGVSPVASGCPFYIGGFYSPGAGSCQTVSQYFNGLIDEVSDYNRALTQGEIQSLYNADAAGKCLAPTAPAITTQPVSQTVALGGTAGFSVAASGTAPLSYQWNFNGTNLVGATTPTLTLTNVQFNQAGLYRVMVTNAFGSMLSSNAILTVVSAPAITAQPAGLTVPVGGTANFSVTADGTGPLGYFWRRGGVPIPGANGTNYSLTNAQLSDSGAKFSCLVTNAYGTALSSNAVLKVVVTMANDLCSGAILIPSAPYDAAYSNAQSTANATSTGDPVPDCITDFGNGVWYQFIPPTSGLMVVDTLGSDFDTGLAVYTGTCGSLTEVACNDDTAGMTSQIALPVAGGVTCYILAGGYSAHVGNLIFHLVYATPPTIVIQPTNQTVAVGTNVTLTTAFGGSAPLICQWYFNGVPLADGGRVSGTTTSSLNILNAQTSDTGNYTVFVTNLLGSTTSTAAVLTVLVPPAITLQPVGHSVPLGLPASFSATVTGGTPLSYQWQLNGTNIPGATSTSYSISAAGTNDFGTYRLVASNAVGVATSADALLTWGQIAAWGRNDYGQTLVPPNLTNVVSIAAGGIGSNPGHSLALLTDGTVVAWGYNAFGQTNVPASATNVVAVAAGGQHCLALRSDGTVIAWGYNSFGQATVPSTLSNVVAIAAGNMHSLALRADGKVEAWGYSLYGQTTVPANLIKAMAVPAGGLHSLAVRADGSVMAWGNGVYGQTNVPLNATNVVAAAGGNHKNLALRADGTVLTWGTNISIPNLPAGLSNGTAIAAGDNYDAVLRSNGTVLTWGYNLYGVTNVPTGVSNAVAVAGGGAHVLALIGSGRPVITRQPVGGTAYAGRDFVLSATVTGTAPLNCRWQFNGVDIPNATNVTLVLSGLDLTNAGNYQIIVSNTMGVTASIPAPVTILNNNTLSFGSQPVTQTNYQGSKMMLGVSTIGNGPLRYQWYFSVGITGYAPVAGATNDTLTLDPALAVHSGNYYVVVSNQVTSLTSQTASLRALFAKSWGYLATDPPYNVTNATAIAVGTFGTGTSAGHYLALRSDGKISPWGSNFYGETNTAALTNSIVTAIAVGYGDSLALRSDGTVYAWGYNFYGQTNVPPGLNSVVAIACGYYHDLALKSDGTVAAWGYNTYGQATNSSAATNVIAIAAGFYHNLALRADGTVVGWGFNGSGQILIPSTATNVIAVAAGSDHSLALRANGTVVGWGNNIFGQTTIPTGLSNVVAISASYNHSTALRSDGTIVTWGAYYSGSATAPSDLANVIQIASGGDHDVGLFGTRAPAITIQPVSRTVFNSTTSVVFVAKAAGVQPVSYQWQLNGTNLPAATNDSLTVTAFVSGKTSLPLPSGTYRLVASNPYGVAISKPAKLAVTIPLGEALDATNRAWSTSGNALWYGQVSATHDGVDAARSGDVGNSQETILQTIMTTNWPGHCSFWWKVSSEDYFDVLEFRLNGVTQTAISGEVDWQLCSIAIPAGTNTLQWRYSKDVSFGSGQDAGWVDQFAFQVDPPVITLQPVSQTVNMGATVQFSAAATGATPLTYQWWQNGSNTVGANSTLLTLTGVGRSRNGTYSVRVSNPGGSTFSSNAVLKVLVPQKLRTPIWLPDGTLQLTSGDADGGLLAPSDLANFEALASTNLVNWVPLTNALSLTNGMLWFQDGPATNCPQRFYRFIENP